MAKRDYHDTGALRWFDIGLVPVSELLPKLSQCIDDMCVLRSVYTDNPNHGPALLLMNNAFVMLQAERFAVVREIKVHDAALRPSELLHLIGRWKNASVSPERAAVLLRAIFMH